MSMAEPVIYLLHGDDDFSIDQYIHEIKKKIGDPALVDLNLTSLDGRNMDLDGWIGVASTMPFLTQRRMTILSNPTMRLATPEAKEKFKQQLTRLPDTATLALVVDHVMLDKNGHPEWLLAWAQKAGERVQVKAFPLPKGSGLITWIQEHARKLGGQITSRAAQKLVALIDDDPRLADQEVQKALLYVNYRRPVEAEDVELLTPDSAAGKVFAMVDALAVKDGRKALGMLERLLKDDEPLLIFGMIIRQFRLLLLARSLYDLGYTEQRVIEGFALFPKPNQIGAYPAKKAYDQCRRFELKFLEAVYERLLKVDEAIKSGQMPGGLALEVFVTEFTGQPTTARG